MPLQICTDEIYHIDKDFFFSVYKGERTPQLDALLWLIDNSERVVRTDEAAYILATVRHECGDEFNMARVEETDPKKAPWIKGKYLPYMHGLDYDEKPHIVTGHLYYGRGPHQLTWYCNYKIQGDKLGVDLVSSPDKILDPALGFESMLNFFYDGDGTGGKYKMSQFFFDDISRFYWARKMINGVDHAETIARYASEFLQALRYI